MIWTLEAYRPFYQELDLQAFFLFFYFPDERGSAGAGVDLEAYRYRPFFCVLDLHAFSRFFITR